MTKVTYAIGDVHGHAEQLQTLLDIIADDMQRYPAGTPFRVIQLGDMIDRGPDSRGVIELCMQLPERFPHADTHVVMGNHEYEFIDIYRGLHHNIGLWFPLENGKGGGAACLRSYGCTEDLHAGQPERIVEALQRHIPQEHIDYLASLPPCVEDDHYLFVHSGIVPGVALAVQDSIDFIKLYGQKREDFMTSTAHHGKIIVHGHTPYPQGEVLHNRVNTDAGAGYSMHLLCAVLPPVYDPQHVRTLSVPVPGEARAWLPYNEYVKQYGQH